MSFQPGTGQPGVAQAGVATTGPAPIAKAGTDTATLSITETASVVVATEIAATDTITVGITDAASALPFVAATDTLTLSLTETSSLVKEATPFQTPSEIRSHMSTTIREAASTTAEPQSMYLRLEGTTAAQMMGLLDVGRTVPIGVGAQVVRAELILTQAEAAPDAYTLTAEPLDGGWTPEVTTWATAPTVRAESETKAVSIGGADGDQVTIDVTVLVANSVAEDDAAADRWYGLRLKKSSAGTHRFYSSFADASLRPVLKIEWSIPPAAAEDLQPTGGRVVSETKPELVSRFFDQDAEDTLSFIRVRIATTDDFETPTYDSGWVAHTTPRFDLASPPAGAPATPTLATATTYYWDVQFKDNHGIESPVSSAAGFSVTAKGTLTLTSPSGSTVTSPTPTITHTFTGATQQSVEVEIERKVAGIWERHYFVPRYISTATSHTVPDDYRLQEGESYRVTVRVWDNVTREDMAGDRAFVEASQEITLTALS